MRDVLEHYIRTLPEREDHADSAQDLNALVVWLLEYLGFDVEYYPYSYIKDPARRASGRGERQFGVDILASRDEADGRTLYRLVLKRGSVAFRDWSELRPGSLPSDISDAASLTAHHDQAYTGQDEAASRVVIVGVFNGDLDRETLGESLIDFERRFTNGHPNKRLEWWDARKLAALLYEAHEARALTASVFAPETRPFVRLVVDSLRKDSARAGLSFDMESVELLLDALHESTRRKLSSDEQLRWDYIAQTISELTLISYLVERACQAHASGNIIPGIMFVERALVFAAQLCVERTKMSSGTGTLKAIRHSVALLLERHLELTGCLCERIAPLLNVEYGLTAWGESEQLDYSLRCGWIGARLALGKLIARELEVAGFEGMPPRQVRLGEALERALVHNIIGFSGPALDDLLIELLVIFEGCTHPARVRLAGEFIARWSFMSRAGGRPPEGGVRAGLPVDSRQFRALIEAHEAREPREKSMIATGLLPVVLYVAHLLGLDGLDEVFPTLCTTQREGAPVGFALQVWQPPDDMPETLYSDRLMTSRGYAHFLESTEGFEHWLAHMRQVLTPQPKTTMSGWGFASIDRVTWLVHRSLPHMGLLDELFRGSASAWENNGHACSTPQEEE